MTTKFMNFLCMCWFVSVLICLIIEGSYFGANENTVINNLSGISTLGVGGLIGIPAFLMSFSQGVVRLLTWDYSFYQGGYQVIRYFWMAILSPGAVWGISQVFVPVFANILRLFR